MYVDKIPNRNSNPTILVRQSKRVGGKIVKITIANITKFPEPIIEGLRILFKGGTAVKSIQDAFDVKSNKPHGHVAAVLGVMKQLKIAELIAPRNSRFRRLVLGMIAARVLEPASKLTTSAMLDVRTAPNTLNEELGLKCVDEDDLYDAMDELVARKTEIECRLATRHLSEGAMVLYDVSSSYVEGEKMAFAAFGYNRDQKKGKKQVVYGLMTDPNGRPVSVEVFEGNTKDTETLGTQITKIQDTFGLKQVILVGDRGILQQKQIVEEVMPVGLDWITGMQKKEIRAVMDHEQTKKQEEQLEEIHEIVEQAELQLSLFDEQNLMEVYSDLYPKERLVLCRNPLQATKSQRTREELLVRAEAKLNRIVQSVHGERRLLKDKGKIGVRVGKVFEKYRIRKFFTWEIEEGHFSYTRNAEAIQRAERLDGVYAIRSSLKQKPAAEELVADYKRLSSVEIAFRTMKSMSLQVRPIHHRKPERIIAHIFLCMLAYYVEYHLRQKLAPMLFAEEDPEEKKAERKSIVEPVKPSTTATKKARTKRTADGGKAMSYQAVMEELSGLCRLTGVPKIKTDKTHKTILMEGHSSTQKQAFKLLGLRLSSPTTSSDN
ncbi:MAG: IS1634 family transposase [Bacteroidetes bacterium]|nr:IS1634 family transposase [Bacteroidota bacterium]